MGDDWPFIDPPDLPVMASTHLLEQSQPIRHAWHQEGYDQTWRFSEHLTGAIDEGREVSLQVVATLHPTVRDLASLPLGWSARRLGARRRWWRHPAYHGSKLEGLVSLALILVMVTVGLPITITVSAVHYGRIERRRRRIVPAVTQAIERQLPAGSRLWRAVAFLYSSDVTALTRSLKLERPRVDTVFKKSDMYYSGSLWSQAYPDGKMLAAHMWTQDKPGKGQQVRLQFFFDRDDRLINYTVEWHVPK